MSNTLKNRIFGFFKRRDRLEKLEDEKKLRTSGRVFHFSFDDCVIKSFNQMEEKEKSTPLEIKMLDGLAGRDQIYREATETCQIVCKYVKKETQLEFVSPLLLKDRTTLTFLLHQNGGLNVFADPDKLENYFFDLDFLK